MNRGYVYVLKNAGMPGLLKIGRTRRPVTARAAELHQTGVPFPFAVIAEVLSPDCVALEADMHKAWAGRRVAADREFFAAEEKDVVQSLIDHHYVQMNWLVSEYLPEHTITKRGFAMDSFLERAMKEIGVEQHEIEFALGQLDTPDIRELIARAEAILDRIDRERDNPNV